MTAHVRLADCELCLQPGGLPVWEGAAWRIVRVADPSFPAFYRVISRAHHREWTDVPPGERRAGMALVEAVEQALRSLLPESKINLASFGNVVAHVHWHVMARFAWDSHFPQPLWGLAQREADAARLESLVRLLPTLDQAVRQAASQAVASSGA